MSTLRRGGETFEVLQLGDRFRVKIANDSTQTLDEIAQGVGGTVGDRGIGEILFTPTSITLQQAIDSARRNPNVMYASYVYEYGGGRLYFNEQITVVYQPSTSGAVRGTVMNSHELVVEQPIGGMNDAYMYEISMSSRSNPIDICDNIRREYSVIDAEPCLEVFLSKDYAPSDGKFAQSWHLQEIVMTDVAPGSSIQVDKAWEVTRGLRSVRVAVIDDGFDINHPDLVGMNKIVAPLNTRLGEIGMPPVPTSANDSHGTPCAGVILAEETGTGCVGIAPGCTLIPIKNSGYITDDYIEQIFDWCRVNNAAVVSCSWSSSLRDYPLSIRQKNAIARCYRESRNGKGAVICFSAGNRNRPLNGTVNELGWSVDSGVNGATTWRAGFAEHPDVLAIAAVTSQNKKALYSSWGKEISVCAPSGDAAPSWGGKMPNPDAVWAKIRGIGVIAPDVVGGLGYEATGDYTYFNGTSCACPVVAGVAALVLSANPSLTAAQVKQILKDTADKITDTSIDPQLGIAKGTYVNGHSEWFGYGRVNAKKAVDAAIALLPTAAFTDIKGHWAQPFLEIAKAKNYISGYADGTFKPNGQLTRAAFAALVKSVFGERLPMRTSAAFSDVPANHWAYSVIDFAYRTGFMSGYADGTFKPDTPMTRLQALVALNNGLGLSGGNSTTLNRYSDSGSIPSWAQTAIMSATANKLVVNYPSPGYLRPSETCLRCEAIAFFIQAKVKLGDVAAIAHDFIVN